MPVYRLVNTIDELGRNTKVYVDTSATEEYKNIEGNRVLPPSGDLFSKITIIDFSSRERVKKGKRSRGVRQVVPGMLIRR